MQVSLYLPPLKILKNVVDRMKNISTYLVSIIALSIENCIWWNLLKIEWTISFVVAHILINIIIWNGLYINIADCLNVLSYMFLSFFIKTFYFENVYILLFCFLVVTIWVLGNAFWYLVYECYVCCWISGY